MTKSRAVALLASLCLLLGLFVVLPGFGADQKDQTNRDAVYRPLGLFTEVLSLVRSNYVEKVELRPLLEGAFSGMTEAMDPFSEYVPPDRKAAFEAARAARVKGKTVEPGLVLARRGGYPVVVSAIPGGPAAAAGIRTDDILEFVDGKPARLMPLWEVQSTLGGAPGGRARVVVVRDAHPRRRTLELVRAAWTPDSPSLSRVEGENVIRIPSFNPGVKKAVEEILKPLDPAGSLVIDIRGNATGELEEAARVAALFVGPGPLGELKGRKIENLSFRATAGEQVQHGRLAVLVDSGTGGPAELFAAGLRDASVRELGPAAEPSEKAARPDSPEAATDAAPARLSKEARQRLRIRLVGEPTFGMGIVQEVVPLASGGALKLSVGKVWTSAGRALSPRGIDPDDRVWTVPPDETAGSAPPSDAILQRGLKVLGEAAAPSAS